MEIKLPTPQCVVFYNGEKDSPEESVLKLSDAFMSKERQTDVELKVRVLNINYGHNKVLMDSCQTLREYAEFVMISRQYAASGMKLQAALNAAVDYCVAHGILDSTLREHRADALVKAYGTVIGTIRPFCVPKEEHELKRVNIHDLKHGKQIKTEEIDAKMMQKRYRIDVSWLYNVNDEENV